LNLFGSIAWAISKIMTTFVWLLTSGLRSMEYALRAPLGEIHITGITQTLIVAAIPFLTLVAVVKITSGILRIIIAPLVLVFLLYIIIPALLSIRI
jgi:hypothetical protein